MTEQLKPCPFTLKDFVRESNHIEGIHREPTKAELDATAAWSETRDFPVAVIASISSSILLCKFGELHEAAEYLMGHPIWTHHFAGKDLWKEMQQTVLAQCRGMPTDAPNITEDNWRAFGIPDHLKDKTIMIKVAGK